MFFCWQFKMIYIIQRCKILVLTVNVYFIHLLESLILFLTRISNCEQNYFISIHTGILKKPSFLCYLCILGLLLTHDCPVGDHPGKMETNRLSVYQRMFQQALHTSLLKIYQFPDVMFKQYLIEHLLTTGILPSFKKIKNCITHILRN